MPYDPNAPYDPDAPPERTRDFIGVLVETAYIDSWEAADALNIRENYQRFMEKSGFTEPVACWFLAADAENLLFQRPGEEPFYPRFTELVKLQGINRHGERFFLRKGAAPDILADQFRNLGYSASYAKENPPAVGKRFRFVTTTVDVGGGYTKEFRLWPTEYNPQPEETRVVQIGRETAVDDAQAAAGALEALVDALNGRPPREMLDVVVNTPALKNTTSLLGITLTEAAADESLANVLVEGDYMRLVNGILVKA